MSKQDHAVPVNKDDVIAALKSAEPELRAKGVAHAALSGSTARGEQLVEISPDAELEVYGYAGIIDRIQDMFPVPVDVANRESLKQHVRPSAMRSMLSEKARLALIDIQFNIAAAQAFVKDMGFEDFKDNLMAFYAVVRALEIISEASRHLPEDLKNRHPGIPWREMRDAGNFFTVISMTASRLPISGKPFIRGLSL